MADACWRAIVQYSDLTPMQKLRDLWCDFCDADPVPPSFLGEMEAAGLIECVPVTAEALDDVFAAKRGIELGGMMWVLTPAGRAALKEQNSG